MHTPRLGKVVDFASLARQGSRFRGQYLTSRVLIQMPCTGPNLPTTGAPVPPRVTVLTGIIVSKKAVDKRAVLRNRVKRRLRPVVRSAVSWFLEQQQLAGPLLGPARPSIQLTTPQEPTVTLSWVVRAERSVLEASTEELTNDVRTTLIQAFERETKRIVARPPPDVDSGGLPKAPEPGASGAPRPPVPLLPNLLGVHD